MESTVRITHEPDFFPLQAGLKLSYHHTSTSFEGVETVEISFASVDAFRDDARAQAVLTRIRMGEVTVSSYRVKRTSKQVFSEGGVLGRARLEFPLPALPGKQWVEEPDRHEIASLEASITVPAGKFQGCLRVNTFLAGGDGGSAIRYYAPGVGYAYEEYSSETGGARVSLVSYSFPGIQPA